MNEPPYAQGAFMLREERITVEHCRGILGRDAENLSDNQIIDLRDALYTLADNSLDSFFVSLTLNRNEHE